MKQIMEAKLLEERLAKGELLEENQVCSIAIITVSYQFLLFNSSRTSIFHLKLFIF